MRRCMDCKAFMGENDYEPKDAETHGLCPVCYAARKAELRAESNERVKQIEDAAGSAATHFTKAFNSISHGLQSGARFVVGMFRVLFLVCAEALALADNWLANPRWPDVRRNELKGAVMYDGQKGSAL